jgi:predicted nucleic acid-binding protein
VPAVSNSSPLTLFSKIGLLDLLRAIFGELYVPTAVRSEVIVAARDLRGASAIQSAPWIKWRRVSDQQRVVQFRVHLGESEAEDIALALQLGSAMPVLLDDRAARRDAHDAGPQVIRCGGVLLRAKEPGVIQSVWPLLDALRSAGLYLAQAAHLGILAAPAELPWSLMEQTWNSPTAFLGVARCSSNVEP